jgi:hypothetical protein
MGFMCSMVTDTVYTFYAFYEIYAWWVYHLVKFPAVGGLAFKLVVRLRALCRHLYAFYAFYAFYAWWLYFVRALCRHLIRASTYKHSEGPRLSAENKSTTHRTHRTHITDAYANARRTSLRAVRYMRSMRGGFMSVHHELNVRLCSCFIHACTYHAHIFTLRRNNDVHRDRRLSI